MNLIPPFISFEGGATVLVIIAAALAAVLDRFASSVEAETRYRRECRTGRG